MSSPALTDIAEVSEAVAVSLRLIPELVSALGDDAEHAIRIYGVDEPPYDSFGEQVDNMEAPSALVACLGVRMGSRGSVPAWVFSFVVALRADGPLAEHALLKLIVDGEPETGEGLRWLDATIHTSFDPPDNLAFVPYLDSQKVQHWQLNFSLTQIGG